MAIEDSIKSYECLFSADRLHAHLIVIDLRFLKEAFLV